MVSKRKGLPIRYLELHPGRIISKIETKIRRITSLRRQHYSGVVTSPTNHDVTYTRINRIGLVVSASPSTTLALLKQMSDESGDKAQNETKYPGNIPGLSHPWHVLQDHQVARSVGPCHV